MQMLKSLIIALSLGAFAVTGTTGQVQAQNGLCTNAPKNYVPCPLTPSGPLMPKLRGK
jgi:hypothetical protein